MGGMGGGDGNSMGGMTFFWGKDTFIIFPGWPGNAGIGMYLLSILVIFVFAAVAEALSAVSNRFSQSEKTASNAVALTAIHALRMGVAYLVMLAVMSFNVGVFLGALAGHAFGFFLARSGFLSRHRTGDLEAHTTTNK